MNSKDLNLSAHIKDIIDAGVIDSLKIEGRTKSEYYVACATRAYKMAVDDTMAGKFDAKIYADELNTLKNRGFTDGYLVHRPFERTDTQNHLSSLEEGTHQVHAISDDGEWFKCKFKIVPEEAYEIVVPLGFDIQPCSNEIGEIFAQDGKMWLKFHKIETKKGKILAEIHSGNENEFRSPTRLCKFSFLRKEFK